MQNWTVKELLCHYLQMKIQIIKKKNYMNTFRDYILADVFLPSLLHMTYQ